MSRRAFTAHRTADRRGDLIAILAAIAVPNFLEAQMRAKVAPREGRHAHSGDRP